MHELRIAESILNIAQAEIVERHLSGLKKIGVRIGALSGVNADSLSFGFQAITAETPLAGVELVIEQIPARGKCKACQKDFEADEFIFICPNCFSGDIETSSGNELDIAYLETE
jgi:hydrogenase nickel incorporation protein HypA/HybF